MSKKTNNSILKDMRQALKMAHNTNNGKAITKDFALGTGCSEEAFEAWCTWCNTLHYRVSPWINKFNSNKVTDEELQEIYKAVFPVLRQLVKVDDKLFVRDSDAVRICGFAAKYGKTANGTVDILKGQVAFRKEIETMLGIRMAQNEVLSEDDYEIIQKYESAVANKDKSEQKLEGFERNGKEIPGLKEQAEAARKVYADMKAIAGVTAEVEATLKKENKNLFEAYPLLQGYMQTVLDLESDIKNTESRIEKATATIKKHEKKYKELMAKIAIIK